MCLRHDRSELCIRYKYTLLLFLLWFSSLFLKCEYVEIEWFKFYIMKIEILLLHASIQVISLSHHWNRYYLWHQCNPNQKGYNYNIMYFKFDMLMCVYVSSVTMWFYFNCILESKITHRIRYHMKNIENAPFHFGAATLWF